MKSEPDAKSFTPQGSAAHLSTRRVSTSSPRKKFSFDLARTEDIVDDVKQERITIFHERRNLAIDRKFEYERNGTDPGLVLIFNQETFEASDLKPRLGSRRDVNEIIMCKQRQGINISADNIFTDSTTEEITAKLKSVAEMDLKEYNFLIVYFLTHGDEFDRLHTKNGSIKTSEIWAPFTRCDSLKNKPKMFVFQACKGDSFTTTGTTPSPQDNPRIVSESSFKTSHLAPDMLVVYSTIEGRVSFRNPLTGSWFIQELCKNINTYGKRDDIVSLLMRTVKCVCGNYYLLTNRTYMKQMPVFMSTLSKKFYLNRNKDRDHVLRTVENDQKTIEELKLVRKQLKTLLGDE